MEQFLHLPRLIAHRGAKNKAPENTLAAINEAARCGAGWVELDVQLTEDNVPVLIHDRTLDRTTNGSGEIKSIDSNSLTSLDAGYWFDARYKGEKVPLLLNALDLCQKLNLGVNLEIKTYGASIHNTVLRTLSVVNEFGRDFEEKILFSSFDTEVLRTLKKLSPNSPRGLLVEKFHRDLAADLLSCDCFSIHPAISFLKSQTTIEKIVRLDIPIIPYTVNDLHIAKRLAELNINTFITDEPKIF
tara:strand:+ start:279 stop:1010 length:732 start_codon:yes stop_codon:yes gene_type:complete